MSKGRLEAFSDGVIAILITIMVLELRPAPGADWNALRTVFPSLLSYVLSFVYLGIYWNNHNQLYRATRRVSSRVLWANLHLLFWLSLIPFVTSWQGDHLDAPIPTAVYGIALFLAGAAYWILQDALIAADGPDSPLARAVGRDLKGKASVALYAAGIAFAFVRPWLAQATYVTVALIWLVPDRRIDYVLYDAE